MAPGDDDDARHRREEAERRAKRKAAKVTRSDAQKEKDRKRKEHAQRVLQQQQGSSSAKRSKTGPSPPPPPPKGSASETSQFEQLFAQRAQGFLIDFKFANAPPRPPVGPCFVGLGLDGHLLERTTFKPYALAEDFVWKLHSEPDLGVPLARWAMDIHSYQGGKEVAAQAKHYVLHPDDVALLEWEGSLGDTAAEQLKQRREQARVAARLVSEGKAPNKLAATAAAAAATFGGARKPASGEKSRKAFSRVLPEHMQSWMKKTTYMANDYSRKVHDFKSLAQTKQQVVEDLEVKQVEISKRKSSMAISKMFDTIQSTMTAEALPTLQHPTNPKLKAVSVMPFLPNVEHWGYSYTHVVLDKAPTLRQQQQRDNMQVDLDKAMIAHVEKKSANARMSCQLLVPKEPNKKAPSATHIEDDDDDDNEDKNEKQARYSCIQEYDLDVIPLKDSEDAPTTHYCLWIDPQKGVATYLPIPSRVQLSIGRPPQLANQRDTIVEREAPLDWAEVEERRAEVDYDLAMKYKQASRTQAVSAHQDHSRKPISLVDHDADDDDDDDSDQDDTAFGNTTATIVAEG